MGVGIPNNRQSTSIGGVSSEGKWFAMARPWAIASGRSEIVARKARLGRTATIRPALVGLAGAEAATGKPGKRTLGRQLPRVSLVTAALTRWTFTQTRRRYQHGQHLRVNLQPWTSHHKTWSATTTTANYYYIISNMCYNSNLP